ncbi:swi5-like zinc finger protein [Dissophora globulifera]|uniref:Swi5-like zinc finger protein n=1 Tax=Dissophora globulifera TaxID=979702 RepID=A0A9P6UXW6_9FUNG|nr:swi5-like zinc finger protein [Dissophora globulifera]
MIEMNDKTDKTDKIDTMTDDGPHQPITTMTRMTMTANVGAGIGKSRLDPHGDMMTIAKEEAKIEELKATILDLERQEQEIISAIRGGGTPSEIIDKHIKQLHRYNEVKDAGQIILGKVAELEGTTIKKQYEVFGLDSED